MQGPIKDTYQFFLQRLVDNKMDHCFWDSEVTGGDAFVEASQTLTFVDSFHALRNSHLTIGVVVQLQTGFDEPDWIGKRGGNKSGTGGTHDVYQRWIGRDNAVEKWKQSLTNNHNEN